jgi:hypothetical protein
MFCIFLKVERRKDGCTIAHQIPDPHEVLLQSVHRVSNVPITIQYSVFLSGVQFNSVVRNIFFAVFMRCVHSFCSILTLLELISAYTYVSDG